MTKPVFRSPIRVGVSAVLLLVTALYTFAVTGELLEAQTAIAPNKLLEDLGASRFQTREEAANQLQQLGYEAADELLLALNAPQNFEQQQQIARLIQQLPGLPTVIRQVLPDCPEFLLARFRDFHWADLPEKVANIRFLQNYPDQATRETLLFAIARYDSDPLIRRFASALYLDSHFPIHSERYQFSQIPSRAGRLLSAFPDRQSNIDHYSTTSLQLAWQTGMISWTSNGPSESVAHAVLVPEAQMLRECLKADQAQSSFPPKAVLESLVIQSQTFAAGPLLSDSPLRFDLETESAVRLLRWGMVQSNNQKSFFAEHESLKTVLASLSHDADVFLAHPGIFCDQAVAMQQAGWVEHWFLQYEDRINEFNTAHPAVLCLSHAAFQLGQKDNARRWLDQCVVGDGRQLAVQYAILAQEVGYGEVSFYLLQQAARLPVDGQITSIWAKLLFAEALATRCEYMQACQKMGWLLTSLHNDPSLANKMDKLLPNGISELRGRYHYFAALAARDQRNWEAVSQHLAAGHALAPQDTNLLRLAWEVQFTIPSSEPSVAMRPEVAWCPEQERCNSLTLPFMEQAFLSGLNPTPVNDSPTNIPSDWRFDWEQIDLPRLDRDYLVKQTERAMAEMEQEIRDNQLRLDGPLTPARHDRHRRELTQQLNRWAYLAASSNQQPELAFQRARQATQLAGDQARFFDTLSLCAQQTGRISDAIQATQMAVALSPHDADFQTRLAELQSVAQNLR